MSNPVPLALVQSHLLGPLHREPQAPPPAPHEHTGQPPAPQGQEPQVPHSPLPFKDETASDAPGRSAPANEGHPAVWQLESSDSILEEKDTWPMSGAVGWRGEDSPGEIQRPWTWD